MTEEQKEKKGGGFNALTKRCPSNSIPVQNWNIFLGSRKGVRDGLVFQMGISNYFGS